MTIGLQAGQPDMFIDCVKADMHLTSMFYHLGLYVLGFGKPRSLMWKKMSSVERMTEQTL